MLVKTVKNKILEKKEGYNAKKPLIAKKQNSAKKQIIIISIIIALIVGYVASDILFFRSGAENKAVIVNQKIDSLQILLNKKIPEIDNAILIQEKQLEDLKNVPK